MPTDATPSVKFTNVDSFKDLNAVEAVSPVTVTAVDGVAPTLSAVHIASNNVKHPTTLAKESNTVTLTFTSSEAIDPPVVTIGNESAGSVAGVGNDWTATLVMDADDPEGAIAFTINFKTRQCRHRMLVRRFRQRATPQAFSTTARYRPLMRVRLRSTSTSPFLPSTRTRR